MSFTGCELIIHCIKLNLLKMYAIFAITVCDSHTHSVSNTVQCIKNKSTKEPKQQSQGTALLMTRIFRLLGRGYMKFIKGLLPTNHHHFPSPFFNHLLGIEAENRWV